MQRLAQEFIPAADEVNHLQRGDDAEARLFQAVAEQGHYGGRKVPTDTRQGTYALSPSGEFLASVNANDPGEMAAMMRRALAKWKSLPRERRLSAQDPSEIDVRNSRAERFYPQDGLVLKIISRDLPRTEGVCLPESDWRVKAWNMDFAWFRKEEVAQFFPQNLGPNDVARVPPQLVRRLAMFTLVDNVRGQTSSMPWDGVQASDLTMRVRSIKNGIALLRLEGHVLTSTAAEWPARDMNGKQTRGIDLQLLGKAQYDLRRGKFVSLEMLGVGSRWGATQYNVRGDDEKTAPIGYFITLGNGSPSERLAPADFWSYAWQ